MSGEPLNSTGSAKFQTNPYNLEKKIRAFVKNNTYTICYFHCGRVKDLIEIKNDT